MSKNVQSPKKTLSLTHQEKQALFDEKLKDVIKEADSFKADYGLEAGIIFQEPGKEIDAFLWPSQEKFDDIMMKIDCPKLDKVKGMILEEKVLKQRLEEMKEQLKNLQHSNRMKKSSLLLHKTMQGMISLDDLNLDELLALRTFLGEEWSRIEKMKAEHINKQM